MNEREGGGEHYSAPTTIAQYTNIAAQFFDRAFASFLDVHIVSGDALSAASCYEGGYGSLVRSIAEDLYHILMSSALVASVGSICGVSLELTILDTIDRPLSL